MCSHANEITFSENWAASKQELEDQGKDNLELQNDDLFTSHIGSALLNTDLKHD